MPSPIITTIAARAGVSKNPVSLALRHDPQIPAATRARIARIARELGYVKKTVVAQLMGELRRAPPRDLPRTLALLNAHQDPRAFTRHPTLPAYVAGCRRRGAQLGYALDEFWPHDPKLYGERLKRLLRARKVRGALVVGLMRENRLPPRFSVTWQHHAVVVPDVRTREPTLNFAGVDHHALVLDAREHDRRLSYTRPGLVVEGTIDRLVEGRFGVGFWTALQALPAADHRPPFFEVEAARATPTLFADWRRAHRPDVILTLHTVVRERLDTLGARVPADLGLVQLELLRGCEDWAGMDQHNDLTGEAAVDIVVSLLHDAETGLPAAPRATLISPSWRHGTTTRPTTK